MNNVFSTFPRTSRDEPSRSTRATFQGPYRRPSRVRQFVADCALLLMAAAFFVGLCAAPFLWGALLG